MFIWVIFFPADRLISVSLCCTCTIYEYSLLTLAGNLALHPDMTERTDIQDLVSLKSLFFPISFLSS